MSCNTTNANGGKMADKLCSEMSCNTTNMSGDLNPFQQVQIVTKKATGVTSG